MSRLAWCGRIVLVALFTTLVPAGAYSQSTASISGVVKDTDAAVLPGVTVTVRNDTTGQSQDVITDGSGRYQVTALGAGSYTVSAALSGFKTATAKSISVAPGQPVAIPLTLELGQLEETVIVTSSSELVNTQNGTVAATLNADQITRMPTPTRNALNAVAFLPGVNTTSSNRNSTINGLPESFLSITLDFEFRLLLECRLAQRPQHVRGLQGIRDHDPDRHHGLVHVQHSELAQSADLQHRGHADVEPRSPHRDDRRQLHALAGDVVEPDHGAWDHAGTQHRLRPRERHVQRHQFPGRVQWTTRRCARYVRGVDRPRGQRHEHGCVRWGNR
jgi:hypothetical protein